MRIRTTQRDDWPAVKAIFEQGIATRQATFENEASVALHLRAGFRVVGTRERIARLDCVWRDTVLMERRRA
jgi:L-amino acid N-acyltransferase YncA